MRKKVFKALYVFLIIACSFGLAVGLNVNAATKASTKTYTISASSKPYKNNYTNKSDYNKYTQPYFTLRSYLEQLEKDGGGTLVLKQGTYVITNTVYVPSNVTIKLSTGVTIKKATKTGSKLKASNVIFQLIEPTKSSRKNVATKYNGASSIHIIGSGTATIDLNYVKSSIAIVAGHNSGVTISGITFANMNDGSFVKLAACHNIMISKNIFMNCKTSENGARDAISLDIPDAKTATFPYIWSKADKTVNSKITIQDNTFKYLERAIGSSKYTMNQYHTSVKILDNTISNMSSNAIRVLNWENTVITGNKISNVSSGKADSTLRGVLVSGAINPTISANIFVNMARSIQIMPWANTNAGSDYTVTYNTISLQNKTAMLSNVLIDVIENYIRYNRTYNEFIKDTDQWKFVDTTVTDFTIGPDSIPYKNYNMNFSTYNETTRQYYVLRTYFEQLERIGGGTLTLEKGTYVIPGTLFVPSNVTVYLEDGVIIKKGTSTETAGLKVTASIFQFVSPAKAFIEGSCSSYNGESNIAFIGKGTAIIDLDYIECIAIVMGHNTNVSITGITFEKMNTGHFIELDASKNVTIENNTFENHKDSENNDKEAINLDTPDKLTQGFTHDWSSYDRTPNKDIIIRNNTFNNLERAIGTHKYSQDQYHTNVQILNNTINKCDKDPILVMNWDSPVIKGNTITDVAYGLDTYRAILLRGVKNPTITGNIFKNVARPIQAMPWKNSDSGSEYALIYNIISQKNINDMLNNELINVGENFIRINKTYNVFDSNTDKYSY